MEIKGNVTLSRDNRNIVTIEIQDQQSRSKFVKICLTLENFALMMTGMSHVECEGRVRDLHAVGKNKISEFRRVEIPSSMVYDRVVIENYVRENFQEDGWQINIALVSHRSIDNEGGKKFVNYSVFKYEDVK